MNFRYQFQLSCFIISKNYTKISVVLSSVKYKRISGCFFNKDSSCFIIDKKIWRVSVVFILMKDFSCFIISKIQMISVVFYIKIPVVLSSVKNTKDFSCFFRNFKFLSLILVWENSILYWLFKMRLEDMNRIFSSNISKVYHLQKWHY